MTMRHGKRSREESWERETVFLVVSLVIAVITVGVIIGQLWIS
jgi:hypothetical protein